MPVPKPKLFIDASVWIAASASATGGSAYILQACRQGIFQIITTRLILQEVERNIARKLGQNVLSQFHHLLEALPFMIQPPAANCAQYQDFITDKDIHVFNLLSFG